MKITVVCLRCGETVERSFPEGWAPDADERNYCEACELANYMELEEESEEP